MSGICSIIKGGHDAQLLRVGETEGEAVIVFDDGTELSKKITAQAISTGHAFSKHATEFAELGVKTNAELQTLIENTISRPSLSGTLQNWRSFYFNSKSRVVVIVNPAAIDKGTVFVIDKMKYPDPMSYIKRLR